MQIHDQKKRQLANELMEQMIKHVREANTVPCTRDILYRTSAECPINIDSLCQQLIPIHCSDRSLRFLKAFILNQRISLSHSRIQVRTEEQIKGNMRS
jgi:hypothetical protein